MMMLLRIEVFRREQAQLALAATLMESDILTTPLLPANLPYPLNPFNPWLKKGKTNLFGASKLVDGEKQTCSGRRGLWMGQNKLVRGLRSCGLRKTQFFGG